MQAKQVFLKSQQTVLITFYIERVDHVTESIFLIISPFINYLKQHLQVLPQPLIQVPYHLLIPHHLLIHTFGTLVMVTLQLKQAHRTLIQVMEIIMLNLQQLLVLRMNQRQLLIGLQ